VIFTSAKSGFQLERLLEAVRYVAAQLQQKVPTALLNRTLQDAVEKRQPVSDLGHRLKFFYATQVKQAPPTFVLFVNRDELFSDQYKKYLGNEMRTAFGYEGCPLILIPRARPKTIEPKRKFKPANKAQAGRMDAFSAARRAKYSRRPPSQRAAGGPTTKGHRPR
jgi:GTP-binding protein